MVEDERRYVNTGLATIAEDTARGGIFLFTGSTLSTIILAVGSIFIARLLGPDNYGLLALSLVVPSLFIGFSSFGVHAALTRFSAKFRREGKLDTLASMLRSGLLFTLLTAALAFLVCFSLADFFAMYVVNRPEITSYIRLASLIVIFQSIFIVIGSSFIGLDKTGSHALSVNIRSITRTLLSPLLIILGFGIMGVIIGNVMGFMAASVVGGLILFKHYKHLGKPARGSFAVDLKNILSYSLPLYLSRIMLLFSSQYCTIILAFFSTNAEIGNYSVAFNLTQGTGL